MTPNYPAKIVLDVKGMSCNHCKESVEKALKTLEGVADAGVDLEKNQVTVTLKSPLSREEIAAAIAEAGYEVIG
ncbi:MAG TPA: heavy-metal-associated domain-containing protein [Firmicutes bacterium]|nr:heavy-metal-associated domain-containing protein [Bacillota bacterium]